MEVKKDDEDDTYRQRSKEPDSEQYPDHLKADYDPSGRLMIKNKDLEEKFLQSILGDKALPKISSNYKGAKVLGERQKLSFYKGGKQMFVTKTKPYLSMIRDKTSTVTVESYNNVLKNLKKDSDL